MFSYLKARKDIPDMEDEKLKNKEQDMLTSWFIEDDQDHLEDPKMGNFPKFPLPPSL